MQAPRILLADNNALMRRKIAMLLHSFEIVDSVADGQQAIDSAVKLKPDILLLDLSMPSKNGIQVASHLRDSGCGTKVIFLTVHEDYDYVETAFSLGALGYVLKCRMETDLLSAIEKALQGRRFTSPFPLRHTATDGLGRLSRNRQN